MSFYLVMITELSNWNNFFFFKQKTAYELRISDWSSDVCSSDLALGLAREISERHGVAVDVAIHAPGREGDHRNHHAHLLTTTRRIGPEGLGAKTRELDQKTSGEVERWRGRWAEMQNRALELANVPDRVDHRSHKRVRQRVVQGKSVSVRVDLGGRRRINNKT